MQGNQPFHDQKPVFTDSVETSILHEWFDLIPISELGTYGHLSQTHDINSAITSSYSSTGFL
jgi:hypothetical protein